MPLLRNLGKVSQFDLDPKVQGQGHKIGHKRSFEVSCYRIVANLLPKKQFEMLPLLPFGGHTKVKLRSNVIYSHIS